MSKPETSVEAFQNELPTNEVVERVVDTFIREEKTGRDLEITVKGPAGEDTLTIKISEPQKKNFT